MVFLIYEGLKERDISDSVVQLKIPTPPEINANWKLEEIVGMGDRDIAGG